MIKVWVIKTPGNYAAQWNDPLTGKRKTKSTGTKNAREAERFAARLEVELSQGQGPVAKHPWANVCDAYEVEKLGGKSPRTVDTWRTTRRAVERVLKPATVAAITAQHISRFSATIRDDQSSEANLHRHLRHLKAFLRWAYRLEYIPAVPHIEMPKGTAKSKGRPLSASELQRFFDAVPLVVDDLEHQASIDRIIWGMLLTGLRLSEAMKLEWTGPVDRGIWLHANDEGRYFIHFATGASKSRRERVVPVTDQMQAFLERTPQAARSGPVFDPHTKRSRHLSVSRISHLIADIGIKSDVVVGTKKGRPKYASSHDLRRTFATSMARSGVSRYALQEMMGHSDPRVADTYYIYLATDDLQREIQDVRQLNDSLNDSSKTVSLKLFHEEHATPETITVTEDKATRKNIG